MTNSGKRFVFFICCLTFVITNAFAQCSFDRNLTINDDSSSVYFVNINGATNNTLSTNGLCGVHIKFRHSLVGDIQLDLISPDGQSITLLGPTSPLSLATNFTVWDINFTPCGSAATPDFSFLPIFDNLQPWGQFGNYSGTYYPNLGCLEDFNSGSVNGLWQIVINDVNLFDTGIIEEFDLFFCDDDGIACESCDARSAVILTDDIVACQGDELLALDIDLSFTNGESDPSQYTNQFTIFSNGSIVQYATNAPDLRSSNPGLYTICHLSVESTDIDRLPSTGSIMQPEDYAGAVSDSMACADLNLNCIDVEILTPATETSTSERICSGDSILFFGEYYKDSGTYQFSSGNSLCDSVFELVLDVVDLDIQINPSSPQFRCLNESITLSADVNVVGRNYSYQWTTVDGRIVGANTLRDALIDTVGTYVVEVTDIDLGCTAADTIEITFDDDPSITLRGELLDCNIDAATITIIFPGRLVDRQWTGPSVVAEGSLTIKVDAPGEYTLLATDEQNCLRSASIEIIGDLDPPILNLEADDIECMKDTGSILIINPEDADSIAWVNPVGFSLDAINPMIEFAGTYIVESYGTNGCLAFDTIEVRDLRYIVDLFVEDDTITCDDPRINPVITDNSPVGIASFIWKRNGQIISNNPLPNLNIDDTYTLCVLDSNQCSGETTFDIAIDVDPPLLEVADTIFRCIDDSIRIGLLNPQRGFRYRWTGPIAFQSNEADPFIFHDGTYNVTVTAPTGCTNTAIIEVVEGPDLPKSSFDIQILDCFNDTASIIATDTAGYTFEWEGPDILGSTTATSIEIGQSGLYIVTITRGADNCKNAYDFQIDDERSYITTSLTSDELDCDTDTVQVMTLVSDTVTNVSWSGPELLTNVLQPDITQPGRYVVEVTGTNGCISIDSIDIIFNDNRPSINPVINTITCDPPLAMQIIESDIGVGYSWVNQGMVLGDSDTLRTDVGGDYTVIVIGDNGCVDSLDVIVPIDTISPLVSLRLDAVISCDDSISLLSAGTVNLDYLYSWEGDGLVNVNGNTVDINEGGWYTVTVTSSVNQCRTIDSINVLDIREESMFDLTTTPINCNGPGQIQFLNEVNTSEILWSGPEAIPNDSRTPEITMPGRYYVTGVSILGCLTFDSIDVLIDTLLPGVSAVEGDTLTCANPSGAIRFETQLPIDSVIWNIDGNSFVTNDTFIQTTIGGQAEARVVGLNGCTDTFSYFVESDTIAPDFSIITDTLTCLKTKILLVLDNYDNISSVHWSATGISTVRDELPTNVTGIYIAEATGQNGCITIDSTEVIDDLHQPVITLVDTLYLPCDSSGVTIAVDDSDIPLQFYRWIGTTNFSLDPSINIIDEDIVYLFAAGSNGCNTIDSVIVLDDNRPIVYSAEASVITCDNPVSMINISQIEDDESYKVILNSGDTISNQALVMTELDGDITIIVHRGNECRDTSVINISIDTLSPNVELEFNENFQCNNTVVNIETSITSQVPDQSIEWSTVGGAFADGIMPPVTSEGLYILRVENNSNGCFDTDTVVITREAQEFNEIAVELFDPICLGEENGLINYLGSTTANGPVTLFYNGQEITSGLIEGLGQGTYLITAIDSFGCEVDTLIELFDGLEYDVFIDGNEIIGLGDSAIYSYDISDSAIDIDSTIWMLLAEDLCPGNCDEVEVSPINNSFLVLCTVSEEGCMAKDSFLIRVDPFTDDPVPNIFNPNSSEGNDRFMIPSMNAYEELSYLRIYDRWGSIVHQEEGVLIENQVGWNGSFRGQDAQQGVYIVQARIRLKNGDFVDLLTDLTLVR